MARELYNAKVETETKERIKQLTEKYKNDGLIQFDGDLLDIAAELLERNLAVQAPRTVIGIEELDQLTSRINRVFVNFIEQNNSFIATLQQEHQDKYEKAKLTIDGYIGDKQDLKEQLANQTEKINELNHLYEENQTITVNLEKELKEKSKFIALLESKNNEMEDRIKSLLELEELNKELTIKIGQISDKNNKLQQLLTDQKAGLERHGQENRIKIHELEFHNKESLLTLEKELTNKFNKQIDEIRYQRDQYVENYNNKISILLEKNGNLFSENQKLQFENQTLLSQLNALKEEYHLIFSNAKIQTEL